MSSDKKKMTGEEQWIRDTLTFKNSDLSIKKILSIFEEFGTISNISKYQNRYFIQFESAAEAKTARSALKDIYNVVYAHTRTKRCAKTLKKNSQNKKAEPELSKAKTSGNYSAVSSRSGGMGRSKELDNTSTKKAPEKSSAVKSRNKSEPVESSKNSKSKKVDAPAVKAESDSSTYESDVSTTSTLSDDKSDVPTTSKLSDDKSDVPTTSKLSDESVKSNGTTTGSDAEPGEGASASAPAEASTKAGKKSTPKKKPEGKIALKHSVIVANIPLSFTLDDIFELVQEVKPIALSEMDRTKKLKMKFCEVFVDSRADIDYLKKKLDKFIICGQYLSVLERSEIV